ncbi:hypothetical protein QJS04_geneDACA009693 [Acorus gramineus]|uniref:Geranylgeranyl pyrophosphate synthase n=1 Tax=Acorus gramineus TaxID=55184 RepID=A0AAV9BDZ1_ACOGR|nr:hypothetical protein QJS04_geneDACA009693 [Acorus gramineus]
MSLHPPLLNPCALFQRSSSKQPKTTMAFSLTLFNPRHLSFPKTPTFSIPKHPTQRTQTLRCLPSSSFDLQTYWSDLITLIDAELAAAIPLRYPEPIYAAMRHAVLAAPGAKRAAPVMCVASCELFLAPRAAALPTACALEMAHAASLVHNDIPYIDDDPRRRGRPSTHSAFGTDLAILAGDALFPLGFRHIIHRTPPELVPPERLLRVVSEIARSVGAGGMALGQFLNLEERAAPPGEELVVLIQEKKFGEMAECSAACGGVIGGADDGEIEMLRRYGRAVGVLYQVVDDILMQGNGSANARDNASYVKVFGVERAMEIAEGLRKTAKEALRGFEKYGEERVAPLYSFVDYAVERRFEVGASASDANVVI